MYEYGNGKNKNKKNIDALLIWKIETKKIQILLQSV